jgi:hypothetical protein
VLWAATQGVPPAAKMSQGPSLVLSAKAAITKRLNAIRMTAGTSGCLVGIKKNSPQHFYRRHQASILVKARKGISLLQTHQKMYNYDMAQELSTLS